jgi:thymidylate kinase
MLITFSGVDSAGKSTQVDMLSSFLVRRHTPSRVMWHRPGYSPLLDAVRATIRRARPGALPPPGPSAQRQQAFSRPSVQRLWIGVALMDTIWHLTKIRWALARGIVVVSDRYVDDWMLDLALHFPQLDGPSWPLARALRRVAPRPRVSLLLLLEWEEVARRAAGKDEPFPDPLDVSRKRFDAYRQLAASGRFYPIDAGGAPDKVHEEIVATLAPLLRSP